MMNSTIMSEHVCPFASGFAFDHRSICDHDNCLAWDKVHAHCIRLERARQQMLFYLEMNRRTQEQANE